MATVTYYGLQVCNLDRPPVNLFMAYEKGEICIGPSLRLSGIGGMAMLNNAELAEEVRAALLMKLRRRHGADTMITIVRCETTSPVAKKVERHSAQVRAKLDSAVRAS